MADANSGKKQTGKVELSVEAKQALYDEAVQVKEQLETVTANQQRIRKEAIDGLKNDEALATQASEISDAITDVLEPYFDTENADMQRVLPLLEDVLKDYASKVKEHSENFIATQVKGEATEAAELKKALKEQWDTLNSRFKALCITMDMFNFDHSEVPDLPQLARGRRSGSGGGSGGRGQKGVKNFKYVFTKNGEEFENWENISRVLFYSSKDSGGTGSDGRIRSAEFTNMFREKFGHSDLMKESWEYELPNGTTIGFKRTELTDEEKAAQEGADDSDDAGTDEDE